MNVQKIVKRIFRLSLFSIILLFSSVSAFAITNVNTQVMDVLLPDANNTVVGVIPTSSFDIQSKSFLKEWVRNVDGNVIDGLSDKKKCYVLIVTRNNEIRGEFTFISCPENSSVDLVTSNTNPKYCNLKVSGTAKQMRFSYDENGFISGNVAVQPILNEGSFSKNDYTYSFIPFNTQQEVEGFCRGYFKGKLIFNDDSGIFASVPLPKPKPEPDEPPKPELEKPTEPTSGSFFPVVPKIDNEYVPYDTTVWNDFSITVKKYIGSATETGFLCLGFIFGIWVIIKIVKRFSRG